MRRQKGRQITSLIWIVGYRIFPNVEFKVCNPVKGNLAGDCSQQQATASILVDIAAAGSVPLTTDGTSSGSGTFPERIVGTWIVIENGKVVDCIDIAPYGDGYKVEVRAGDGGPTYWNGFGIPGRPYDHSNPQHFKRSVGFGRYDLQGRSRPLPFILS